MAGHYVLMQSPNGTYRFVLQAANGEAILVSESYTTKSGAVNGIESVKRNAQVNGRFRRRTTSNGGHMFNLIAANGEVIGSSESYSSEASLENAIQSVMMNALGPTVDR